MTKPNVALLEETLTYIRDHPEEWNQRNWVCGTTACFAGRAVLLTGATLVAHTCDLLACVNEGGADPFVSLPNNMQTHISDRARHELGLTDPQAGRLFQAANTMDDLERIVKDIINESQDGLHA